MSNHTHSEGEKGPTHMERVEATIMKKGGGLTHMKRVMTPHPLEGEDHTIIEGKRSHLLEKVKATAIVKEESPHPCG